MPRMPSRSTTIASATNGTLLAYDSFGDQKDPPLLLISGLSSQLIGWPPDFCRQLADAGCFVIRFDNRDVGCSQKFPTGGYLLADMADDAAGLVGALGISNAHIVGQSMGGMIALEMAARHPNAVSSLGLIYTSPSLQYIIGRTDLADRPASPAARNRDDAVELYVVNEASCRSEDYPQDVAWLTELGGLMYDRDADPGEGVRRQRQAIVDSPDRDDLARAIAVPTTILAGDGDLQIDPAASAELHRLIAGSTLRIHPGMGHELPRELWPEIVEQLVANARRSEERTWPRP
jgi:pimeloyl-ACP methyl ester carboxylesterase